MEHGCTPGTLNWSSNPPCSATGSPRPEKAWCKQGAEDATGDAHPLFRFLGNPREQASTQRNYSECRILQMVFAIKTAPGHSKEEIRTHGTRNYFSKQRSRSHRWPGDWFLGHLGHRNAGSPTVLTWLNYLPQISAYSLRWRNHSWAVDLNHDKKSWVQQQRQCDTCTTELFKTPSRASRGNIVSQHSKTSRWDTKTISIKITTSSQ